MYRKNPKQFQCSVCGTRTKSEEGLLQHSIKYSQRDILPSGLGWSE